MILETVELTRIFHHGSSNIIAVNKVNLKVEEASFISIIGPSGSGKTTLLNLIGLNDNPTSGKIVFQGKDTSEMGDWEKRRIRLFNIGFVFQTFNLLPTLTALENVEMPMALAGTPQKQQRERALTLLDMVGLSQRKNHRPNQLSAGEMQRVAIARALANKPVLILADEPTGELDTETGSQIIKLLYQIRQQEKTAIIVATHDEKISRVADIVYKMRDGILLDGK
ncbi:MAG: ABC transporter ATP-binding protein [Candidatus Bathyarchaeia archaeon]